ncbi:ankyrin repeat-containing domain protein [Leptodontidium sp. 2 PMI_412]|nr:ankyrin repeat-containing domain protein [Leptodontidium sp. 2 PMI_412]
MPSTDEEWERQKAIIHELYTSSTLTVVMKIMADKHGFHATKSHYETKFAKWNWRKNLNSSDWRFVLEKKRKRAALGKESNVTLNGNLIPHKRIQKEEQRLTISQLSRDPISCPSPAPPEGIDIFTPCPSPASEAMIDAMTPKQQDTVYGWISGVELPFSRFMRSFNWQSCTMFPSKSPYDFSSAGLRDLSLHNSVSRDSTGASRRSPDLPCSNLSKTMIFEMLPNPNGAMVAPETEDRQKAILLRRLKVCMLDQHDGDLEGQVTRLLGTSESDALQELLKLMIYFSSNAMLELSQQKRALEWITLPENRPILKRMFSTNSHSVRAFLDSMLKCSLETRNIACGKALLDTDHHRTLLSGRPGKLLDAAIRLEHIDLVRKLKSEGVIQEAPIDEPMSTTPAVSRTPAIKVSRKGQRQEYARLLDVDPRNYAEGHSILQDILGTCQNMNLKGPRSGRTILQYALESKDLAIAGTLVRSGADLHAQVVGNSGHLSLLQLALAIEHFPTADNVHLVRLMLSCGADVNAPTGTTLENGTPLQIACSRNNFELVRLLLVAGAEINAPPDCSASTAFQAACHAVAEYSSFQLTSCDIVKYMVGKGADINAPAARRFGRTALQLAVSALNPSLELVEYLLGQDANVHAPAGPMQGITALQGAAIQGHLYLVKMLLDKGADPSAPGSGVGGRTALEGAAERGRLDTVQMLIDAGAHVSQFASAAAFAEKRGHYVVADLIRSQMSAV